MATISGNDGTVYIATQAVGEVKSFSYDDTCDTMEDTAMGDSAKSYMAGHLDGSGSVECHMDEDDAGQEDIVVGTSVALKLRPSGTGAGNDEYTGTVLVTGKSISQSLSDVVSTTFSFTGRLTESAQS
jgi:hypothetical protein